MGASALRQPEASKQSSPVAARSNIVALRPDFPSDFRDTARLMPAPRRGLRSAAAQEELHADLRFVARMLAIASCIGVGLAVGIHWDDILADVRLAVFAAEEPRWLWQIVDNL